MSTSLVVDGNKTCTLCKEVKSMSMFSRNKKGVAGLHARCRLCTNAIQRDYRSKNIEQHRQWGAAYYVKNREQVQEYNLTRLYGITSAQYSDMLLAQDGLCALCSKPALGLKNGGRLHVDHDHATGKIRALLCHHCNRGLGCFYDDAEALRRAANYLESHRK